MGSEAETGDSGYVIRNFRPADFDSFVELITEAERLDPRGRAFSPAAVRESLGRPRYTPEGDLMLAELAGALTAYIDLRPEPLIDRVVADCWVQPAHRRKGLATSLYAWSVKRTRELGLKYVHTNVFVEEADNCEALERLGFACVRRYLELRLDLCKLERRETDPEAVGCRHLKAGEEAELTDIQNRAFRGSWGFNPSPIETIIYELNLTGRSPADVLLACDGERTIGYSWTALTGSGQGRLLMLGTDPAYRGRGVGRQVLLCGLAHLIDKGADYADLTVDSDNTTAVNLYYSVGFEKRTGSLWYEKVAD